MTCVSRIWVVIWMVMKKLLVVVDTDEKVGGSETREGETWQRHLKHRVTPGRSWATQVPNACASMKKDL